MASDYKFFIVLDGLFLLDWHADGLNILISATPMHKHSVAVDTVMDPATRPDILAAQDYTVKGLKPRNGPVNPFPADFDLKHLSLTKSSVNLSVQNASNPHALISVDELPDAIFGAARFSVMDCLLLGSSSATYCTRCPAVRRWRAKSRMAAKIARIFCA